MLVETLSTFPSMYDSVMGSSMMRIAQEKGILTFKAYDLRYWTHDRHRTTDDEPYGGGAGLVMKCEPIFEAYRDLVPSACRPTEPADAAASRSTGSSVDPADLRAEARGARAIDRISGTAETLADVTNERGEFLASACAEGAAEGGATVCTPSSHSSDCSSEAHEAAGRAAERRVVESSDAPSAQLSGIEPVAEAKPHVIFLAPGGRRFDDALACELAREERLLFVCGHYEGIDERAYTLADTVISLGDYVLTSGELASMVVIDAVVRKLPGVLGAPDGAEDESFADGLLEYPQYTRPSVFEGMEVPPILLSGNHAAIAKWRREQSLERTARLRPDLLESAPLTADDRDFLKSLSSETADDA